MKLPIQVTRWPHFAVVAVTVLAQVLLVAVTYKKLLLNPHDYLLCKHYDGIKTYYTYQYYINQAWQKGSMLFTGMNYPFGDYILYTDNGPLIAWLVKAAAQVVPAVGAHAIPVYNFLMLGFIVLSSYLLVKILSLLLKNQLLIIAFSLILPWTNPQIMRFTIGHMNLSISAALLVGIYCLLRLYLAYFSQERSRKWVLLFVSSLVVFSLIHMYYLVLVLAFTGFFYLFWWLQAWKRNEPRMPIFRDGLLLVSLPLVICVGVIRLIDRYNHLRNSTAQGYDWIEWKLNFSALFTPYGYNKVRFLFESANGVPYESYAYLGAFGLFGMLVWLGLRFFGNRAVYSFEPLKTERTGQFLVLLGLAALASLFISLGDYYYVADGKFRFVNYLNTFFYLQKLTNLVTQFRCLGRFVWIFFWTFNFVLLFLIDRSLSRNPAWWFKGLVAVLVALAAIDLKNTLGYSRHDSVVPNILYAPEHLTEVKALLSNQNPKAYQALLTIPFYHVGSEGDYSYTIDPEETVSNLSMQLSLHTGLPLMASKLARTPPRFAQLQFATFQNGQPADTLRALMDNRPVLVIYNKAYYDGRNNYFSSLTREPAATVVNQGAQLPERLGMQKLHEVNDWVLYKWQPR